jgi:uracil-DNA glycosylase
MLNKTNIPSSWSHSLAGEFDKPYMQALTAFLNNEKALGKIIYPEQKNIFNAFKHTDFESVKVVIIGQDPYHGEGQAHGLSFSVPTGVKIPPSLRNMYKEIEDDIGGVESNQGNLTAWADQGVLMLNAVLTVEQAKAGAHQKKGWETFTDHVIQSLSDHREGIVFVLWGGYAHKKGKIIDTKKHHVLKGVHPSPLSAYRGFFGCKHFSLINAWLVAQGDVGISW